MSKVIILAFTFFPLLNAFGQISTSEITPSDSEIEVTTPNKIEKMEVTGSHIKRIDVEGVAPINTIESEEFKKVGATEITDVLKEDAAFEAVYEGSGHVRFRGQHAGNVLILFNGMRMPKLDGGYYTTVRNLPTSAIKRVEMLKDGGSAVYGSDAMSGVMNFIINTEYDGANVGFSSTMSEIGKGTQQNYEGVFGKNYANGNFMGVIQYEKSAGYTELDVGSFNRSDSVIKYKASNATLSGDNRKSVGPMCANGEICETDPLLYDEARSDNEDFSMLLSGKYEFQNIDVSLLGLFHRKEVTSIGDPGEVNWRDNSSSGGLNTGVDFSRMAPSSLRDTISNDGLAKNGFVNVNGSFIDELGEYITEAREDNYNSQLGITGYIGDSWTWALQSGAGITSFESTVVSGEADQNKLREMFEAGEWDILGGGSNLSSAKITPTKRSRGELLTSKLVFAGDVFEVGETRLSMAVGSEYQQESFEFNNDAALVDGSALARKTRNYGGKRDVRSAFAEVSVFMGNSLEIQLAQRVDTYSDVGSTNNPKFGLLYRPLKELLLRGTVSTGFRAPGISDLYAGDEESLSRFDDQANCSGGECLNKNYDVTTYTTNNTKSETSLAYSFGTVVQPAKGVTFTVDQWNFEGENTLTALRAADYTLIEKEQGAAELQRLGASVVRNESGELESIKHPRVINLGERTLRGIDASLDFDFKLSGGVTFNIGGNGSFIFERKDKRFDFEDETDAPDTWKNRNYLGFRTNSHFVRLGMLTVSKGMVSEGRSNERTLPQYTEYDFSYGYTASWGGKFNLALKNLANTRPPVNDGQRVTFAYLEQNYSSFSPLRRRMYLSYNQSF